MKWNNATSLTAVAAGCLAALAVAAVPIDGDRQGEEGYDERGAPEEISALAFTTGRWDVSMVIEKEGQPHRLEGTAAVEGILDGAGMLEKLEFDAAGHAGSIATAFTFDRFRDVYRVARIDSRSGLLDVYEGGFEDGSLVLTNVRCGTTRVRGSGVEVYTRMTLTRVSEARFETVYAISADGATWTTMGKMVYTRRA